MIRLAAAADVDRIVSMGLRFISESAYRGHLVPDRASSTQFVARLVDGAYGTASAVLVAGDDVALVGMLGLFCFPHPFSGALVATETFWWVDPAHRGRDGIRLLEAGLAWAVAHDATAIFMIAPNAKVARFYERRGFVAVETSYVRAL